MTKVFSLLEFIAEIPAIERDLHAVGPMIVEKACKIVQARAKKTIGSNQASWPPLAASTIAEKQREGYKTPAPLLRTGELRDSIEYQVHGTHGEVFSEDPVATFQELGTKHIPPRSFLASSAIASESKIHKLAAAATIGALAGHSRHASALTEILHLLREAGHELREIVDDALEDDTDSDK